MNTQIVTKLRNLRTTVSSMIPGHATPEDVWSYLGWDEEASAHYPLAKARGIDLRPIIAPIFSDVISLVADGHYIQGCNWNNIIYGEVPEFAGETVKERILSVIDSILLDSLDS